MDLTSELGLSPFKACLASQFFLHLKLETFEISNLGIENEKQLVFSLKTQSQLLIRRARGKIELTLKKLSPEIFRNPLKINRLQNCFSWMNLFSKETLD